ncbi:MotE family protein [Microvirga flocculans]|uniref:MotE family protein n=1 Tax=Microvirga flocculans TaxID=217168 RepID=UPI000480E849|nr:MotE family protein [Microvirga flocculans]
MIHRLVTKDIRRSAGAAGLLLAAMFHVPAQAQENGAAAKGNQFCANIADAASDARFALQKQALADMEKEIESRLKVLEAKRAEYEEWLRRRNEVLEKADETIVLIYSRMRPDAAALQLTNMDDEIAAAVIAKLNPRIASAVLNEMEPARAAQLANVITDAPRREKNPVRQN